MGCTAGLSHNTGFLLGSVIQLTIRDGNVGVDMFSPFDDIKCEERKPIVE